MIELEGDIWDPAWDDYELPVVRVIPTNGSRNAAGQAVMGRGVAKQAQERFPGLRTRLGLRIREDGNHVHYLASEDLATFPVKRHWSDPADLGLIARSAKELVYEMTSELGKLYLPPTFLVLPRVGCGNGGLRWTEVRPVLAEGLKRIEDSYCVVWTPKYEGQ